MKGKRILRRKGMKPQCRETGKERVVMRCTRSHSFNEYLRRIDHVLVMCSPSFGKETSCVDGKKEKDRKEGLILSNCVSGFAGFDGCFLFYNGIEFVESW